jgi:ubiquitin-protein ligase
MVEINYGVAKYMRRSISKELFEIQGVFPSLQQSDFKELPNGNICVEVSYYTSGRYSKGRFDVLIEYPPRYPSIAPNVWVQYPAIKKNCPHVYKWDSYNDAKICYILPSQWKYTYTSYDVAIMVQTWIYAYCVWLEKGYWDWKQAGIIDHIFH